MDREQLIRQARDEITAPEILAKLARSEDKEIREYIASNPNTPIDTLEKLGVEFPDEIVANPIFNLLLLESPQSYFIRLSLARCSTTQAETLIKLADLDSITVKEIELLYELAKNPNTPSIVLAKLFNWHPHWYYFYYGSGVSHITVENKIRCSIASHQNTSVDVLEKMAIYCSKQIHRRISNHEIKPKTLKKLRKGIDFQILRVIAANLNTSDKILEYLAAENCPTLHELILKHPNVSQKAIDIIHFRQRTLKKYLELLEELVRDWRAEVRALVASYSKIPLSIMQLLAQDCNLIVLLTLLENPDLPASILEELAKTYNRELQKNILQHRNLSNKAKEIILLMRSHCPVKISNYILEELARDKNRKVRKKVVQNELTPNYILKEMLKDRDRYIKRKAQEQLNIKK